MVSREVDLAAERGHKRWKKEVIEISLFSSASYKWSESRGGINVCQAAFSALLM
jgi:hypothetical protein